MLIEGIAAGASVALHARDDDTRAAIVRDVDELGGLLDTWVDTDRWEVAGPAPSPRCRRTSPPRSRAHPRSTRRRRWLVVAEMWAGHGMRPREAYARFRAAEAFVRDDDRDAAAASARDAYALARDIGWVCVRDAIASLARRARLDLGTANDAVLSPADRYGLTARELDVVALVAEGRTNRQIADALFISAKTASVHVSNILAKLGVTNRGEAAAAARRLGLDLGP